MKEYRLLAWPELTPAQNHTRFRRLLSDISHRHVSLERLCEASGLRRHEVREFLDSLVAQGLVQTREAAANDSLFGPLGGWLRRTFDGAR